MDIGGKLSSRQLEANFSKERFQLHLIPEGNLVLNAVNLPTDNPSGPYYTSGTSISDSVASNLVNN